MPSIIHRSSDEQANYLPLGKRTTVIGRSESLPMQVLDNKVSRKHLRIRYDEGTGRYWAGDMESRHGVFINGQQITEETELNEGDTVRIGTSELLFTEKDFDDARSALHFYKKAGERDRPTFID